MKVSKIKYFKFYYFYNFYKVYKNCEHFVSICEQKENPREV